MNVATSTGNLDNPNGRGLARRRLLVFSITLALAVPYLPGGLSTAGVAVAQEAEPTPDTTTTTTVAPDTTAPPSKCQLWRRL